MKNPIKPLLAYLAYCDDDENNAALIYATNGAAARRQAAHQFDIAFEAVETCCRAKELDGFAPSGPGAGHMIEHYNWYSWCDHCMERVCQLTEARQYVGSKAFCSPECVCAQLPRLPLDNTVK